MDKHITAPITKEVARTLKAGDYVYITGTIYTARDAAHKRMYEILEKGEDLPIDIKEQIIYYMGPSPAREGRPIGSAGPTTASRMDKYAPQLLDLGQAKRLTPIPGVLAPKVMDNGRYYMLDHLMELPFKETPHRVITKGFLNLQNRNDLLTVEEVTPNQWLEFSFELQPTIYKMKIGDTLRLVLYTTDFEHTVRDNTDYHLTIDLANSSLDVPDMIK